MVGSMEGRGRTALGEDLAEAAGDANTDFLEPSLVSASSFAIFSPEPSLASLGRFTAVKPCTPRTPLQNGATPPLIPHMVLLSPAIFSHMQSSCGQSVVSQGHLITIKGMWHRWAYVQVGQQKHLSKQLHSGRHRDVLWDVVARRLAAKLVHGGVARARIDVAPEHAGGRVVHQGRWI